MDSNGYPTTNSLPYTDNVNSSLNMNMSLVPISLPPSDNAPEGFNPEYTSNVTFESYTTESPMHFQHGPRNRRLSSSRKVKTEMLFASGPGNSGHDLPVMQVNEQPHSGIQIMGRSPHLTTELQLTIPKGRLKGRGRGRGTFEPEPLPPKPGKGRAATQGVVIPISHLGREEALAEQALKRKRVEGDEPQDDTEDRILQGLLTRDTVDRALSPKKRKPDGKGGKREHHACDRCFRNKTKVSIRVIVPYN